jgi:hypothetical protein
MSVITQTHSHLEHWRLAIPVMLTLLIYFGLTCAGYEADLVDIAVLGCTAAVLLALEKLWAWKFVLTALVSTAYYFVPGFSSVAMPLVQQAASTATGLCFTVIPRVMSSPVQSGITVIVVLATAHLWRAYHSWELATRHRQELLIARAVRESQAKS